MPEQNLKHKTKIGMYWSFASQFTNYGVQFVIGIIMARLLSPEDYGITALPAVFMAIAGVFIDCGFSSALIRKDNVTEDDLSTSFYYSIIVGVICYFAIFFTSPYIAVFYDTPVLEKLMRITALSFIITPLNTPQNVILKRRLDFKTPTIISVVSIILSGFLGIYAAYNGYGLWALVIMSLSSTLLQVILNTLYVRWYPKRAWSKDSFHYLFGFGSKMMITFLIDKIYTNITPVVIGKFYSPAQLGVYNRALGYANMPSSQLTNVIQQVTFPVLSKIKNDDSSLERNYRKLLRLTAYLIFPIMFLMAALAKPLVVTLVTEKWIECVPYLILMCFWLMWMPIHSLNLNLLLIKGRSDLFLKLEIIKKTIGVAIMAITLPMGIIQFLIGSIVASLIALFINTYYTGKLINVGFIRQMFDLLPIILVCGVSSAVAYLVSLLTNIMWVKLLFGSVSGVLVYAGISLIFHFPEIKEVKYLLNRKA